MKRSALIFGLMLAVSVGPWSAAPPLASAKETWISLRSSHFLFIGNADEQNIRRVAIKLEQFRAVFARLFSNARINAPAPTRVIVFRNDAAYRPFKPLYQGKPADEVAGYFHSTTDINYLTMIAELRDDSPYAIVFHEYVHGLMSDNLRSAPLWVREGLAEYYSTFEVAEGGKKIWLGKPRADHARRLREQTWLPLREICAAGQDSPYYNEAGQRSLFYAQSWALMHYLMLGNQGQRQEQFLRFLNTLAQGVAVEKSFREAFHIGYAEMESELRAYISHGNYPVRSMNLDPRLEFDAEIRSAPLSEAEAQAFLGDLLLHLQRTDEAEVYLREALALDPELAQAQASLGILRAGQRRFAEAKQHVEQATAADPQNFLVHYYYAFALSREYVDEERRMSGVTSEAAQAIRAALRRAITLAPEFAEAYHLLAFVNVLKGEQLDESRALLERAITLAPSRDEYVLTLAQLHMRRNDYEAVRRVAEPLARQANSPELRAEAQAMIRTVEMVAERMAEFNAGRELPLTETHAPKEPPPKSLIVPERSAHNESAQARGLLTRIDCDGQGVTLVIQTGDRVMKLQSSAPEKIQLISAPANFKLECGPRQSALPVLVTYRAASGAKSGLDGEPLMVEFVKPK